MYLHTFSACLDKRQPLRHWDIRGRESLSPRTANLDTRLT